MLVYEFTGTNALNDKSDPLRAFLDRIRKERPGVEIQVCYLRKPRTAIVVVDTDTLKVVDDRAVLTDLVTIKASYPDEVVVTDGWFVKEVA